MLRMYQYFRLRQDISGIKNPKQIRLFNVTSTTPAGRHFWGCSSGPYFGQSWTTFLPFSPTFSLFGQNWRKKAKHEGGFKWDHTCPLCRWNKKIAARSLQRRNMFTWPCLWQMWKSQNKAAVSFLQAHPMAIIIWRFAKNQQKNNLQFKSKVVFFSKHFILFHQSLC